MNSSPPKASPEFKVMQNEFCRCQVQAQGGWISNWDRFDPTCKVWRPLLWSKEALTTEVTNADSQATWPGYGMPVMFPEVGRSYDGEHRFFWRDQDTQRPMPLHGILYQSRGSLVEIDTTHLRWECRLLNDTFDAFPYNVLIKIDYRLQDQQLSVTATVLNCEANRELSFCWGLHPFFAVADSARIEVAAQQIYAVSQKGWIGEPIWGMNLHHVSVQEPHLKSAIISELKGTSFKVVDGSRGLTIYAWWQEPWVKHLITWIDLDCGYVCIEPWSHLPGALSQAAAFKLGPGSEKGFDFCLRYED